MQLDLRLQTCEPFPEWMFVPDSHSDFERNVWKLQKSRPQLEGRFQGKNQESGMFDAKVGA